MMRKYLVMLVCAAWISGCSKSSAPAPPVTPLQAPFKIVSQTLNGIAPGASYYNVNSNPVIRFSFSAPVDHGSVAGGIYLKDFSGAGIPYNATYANQDSTVIVQPVSALKPLTRYSFGTSANLESQAKAVLQNPADGVFLTALDSTDKFPRVTDSALLTLVQQKTFTYFWDFGHPVSGLARERASNTETVTTGGSGFGVMAILVGAQRNFVSRADALGRISTIVNFLSDSSKVTRYHGAFSHWMSGSTGATIPFSMKDDGGDIVETAYMLQGLLCARQYFSSATDSGEIRLRAGINRIWSAVDWNWYRQNGQNNLYWNWSPDFAWAIDFAVQGWNEALITYVLAASAPSDSIPKTVYDNGWARNGGIRNGKSFYGITLPLGPDGGGPLFFAHYSFLGINPNGLSDAYANYWTQDTAHTKINYAYCVANPKQYFGYSKSCWGLTASDEQNGYGAHAPDNDVGVISPTAAISSLPYSPAESMNALRFFYYTIGDKIWGQYGFIDAFSLSNTWFDNDFLAIDQGPEIVMIENYRSGLLWNLFMSCPEIKAGMTKLGFQGPSL